MLHIHHQQRLLTFSRILIVQIEFLVEHNGFTDIASVIVIAVSILLAFASARKIARAETTR